MPQSPLATAPTLRRLSAAPTLSEEAAAQLREQILTGHIRFGERLVEAQLARDLGISRGTVREALAQLRTEHLVQEVPRRGTYVIDVGPQDVEELFDLRAGLETTAIRRVLSRGADGLVADLRAVLERMDVAAAAAKHDELTRLDFEFHDAICRHSGNTRLIDAFQTHTSLLRALIALEEREYYPDSKRVIHEHHDLLEGIVGGDADVAQNRLIRHLEDAKARLMRTRAKSDEA